MILHHGSFLIRKSAGRSLFAAHRSLSQLITSFIGSWCQGIHLMLLFAWTSFFRSITFVAMIDPWFSFFRIAWVSWTFGYFYLYSLVKRFASLHFFLALFRISTFRWNCIALSCLPNFILGKTNKMCCFYLSSNICSFSTQNINFYIDFFLIRLSKISFARFLVLVGLDGLEPSTSRLSGARSNHLSYRPFFTHGYAVLSIFPLCFSFPFPLSEEWRVKSEEVNLWLAKDLVEMKGIEPLTPCLQGRCSPSWATPPYRV